MAGKRGRAYVYHEALPLQDDAPSDAVKVEFARRLQKEMVRKGWNQSELARQAQLHLPEGQRLGRDNISTYIGGRVLPNPNKLHAMAKALGVRPDDLLPQRPRKKAVGSTSRSKFHVRDIGDGNMWLSIDAAFDSRTALEVMKLLIGQDGSNSATGSR